MQWKVTLSPLRNAPSTLKSRTCHTLRRLCYYNFLFALLAQILSYKYHSWNRVAGMKKQTGSIPKLKEIISQTD